MPFHVAFIEAVSPLPSFQNRRKKPFIPRQVVSLLFFFFSSAQFPAFRICHSTSSALPPPPKPSISIPSPALPLIFIRGAGSPSNDRALPSLPSSRVLLLLEESYAELHFPAPLLFVTLRSFFDLPSRCKAHSSAKSDRRMDPLPGCRSIFFTSYFARCASPFFFPPRDSPCISSFDPALMCGTFSP